LAALHRRARVLVGLAALACLGASSGANRRIPWPFGAPPTATQLKTMVSDATRLASRTRAGEIDGTRTRDEELENTQVLQARLDAGRYDNEVLFNIGDELFEHAFRKDTGFGGLIPGPGLRRVHKGRKGALDSHSCAGCHSVGGPDGAGAATQSAHLFGDGERASTAMARNPPPLLGAGLVQALGAEMSAELARQRDRALAEAARSKVEVRAELAAKGISFGSLVAKPDGSINTAGIEGITADLIVRPFGWKGDAALLRRMVEEAARLHFGAQSHPLALRNKSAPDAERVGAGSDDPDGDGVEREVEEGTLSAVAAYLAMLETPVIVPPSGAALLERWAQGDALFTTIGCSACHVRSLRVEDPIWKERSDTGSGEPIGIHLLADGEQPRGNDQVMLFSDLKRHDMGDELADPRDHPDGIARRAFLTRPLWGLAESAPYLHDGRAATIPEAIAAHGGEAAGAREAWEALSREDKGSLHVFLLSLTRQPKVRFAR
jgi:hypothetical protein